MDVATYQFPHSRLEMAPESDHLRVEFENGGTLPAFPEAETKFFSKPWPLDLSQNGQGEFPVLKRFESDKEEIAVKK